MSRRKATREADENFDCDICCNVPTVHENGSPMTTEEKGDALYEYNIRRNEHYERDFTDPRRLREHLEARARALTDNDTSCASAYIAADVTIETFERHQQAEAAARSDALSHLNGIKTTLAAEATQEHLEVPG